VCSSDLWKEIIETCASFATSEGGVIYIGISPKGERVGVQIGRGTIEDLVNKIKTNTEPPLFPSVKVKGDESSAVIELGVVQNTVKPVSAFGRPIKRVGRTNQVLKRVEAQRLVETSTGKTWDTFLCEGFTDKDISKRTIRDYLRRCGIKISTPFADVVHNMRMTVGNGYSNAAALLFGDKPQRFIIQAQTKCARFNGNDSVNFLDERTFEGSIFSQLDEAMAFVARNTRRSLVITGKPAHDVVPEYPEDAVREAIINALSHRDYADGGTVQVRIYDNCMEVWNPGSLPHDLTIKNLYRMHRSHPRNVQLAGAFFRANYVEQWGSGTLRMIETCKRHNIKVEFENEANTFIVRFRKKESLHNKATQSPTQSTDPVMKLVNALQREELSSGQLRQIIGVKHRPTFRKNYLHPALSRGLVRMTVPDQPNSRMQKYRLTAKGKAAILGK